jgi:hypothetical protein
MHTNDAGSDNPIDRDAQTDTIEIDGDEYVPRAEYDKQHTEIEQQADRIDELEAATEEQADEITALRDMVEKFDHVFDIRGDTFEDIWMLDAPLGRILHSADRRSKRNRTAIEEEQSSDDDPGETTDNSTEQPDESKDCTSLFRLCTWNKKTVVTELSANMRRAWEVAKDYKQYAAKSRSSYALSSSDIATILHSKGEMSDTKTVSRVMDWLEQFGGEHVETAIRRGKRKMSMSVELTERIDSITSADRQRNTDGSMTSVVIQRTRG